MPFWRISVDLIRHFLGAVQGAAASSVNLYMARLALESLIYRGTTMKKIDWLLLAVFIVGFVLFLVGANTWNATVGYGGIYMCIGAVAAYLLLYIYHELTKKETCEVPAPPSPQNP
jgi:membrane-bound ClpP family serine protease